MDKFHISSAASTRDLSLYREEYPRNIVYDRRIKEYYALKEFSPAYAHNAAEALNIIANQLGDNSTRELGIICEDPPQIDNIDINILAEITKAMHNNKPLELNYFSLSSGLTKRVFAPFAIVHNGLRWHVRGYDRKRSGFKDFVINRIQSAEILAHETILQEERKENDIQWNRIVEMEIVPHPNLKHQEVIEQEYRMQDGVLKINARAAVVGYFLRRWNIDCSPDYSGSETEHHLWLKNSLSLYGVSNIKLAPLYTQPDE